MAEKWFTVWHNIKTRVGDEEIDIPYYTSYTDEGEAKKLLAGYLRDGDEAVIRQGKPTLQDEQKVKRSFGFVHQREQETGLHARTKQSPDW